MRQLRLKFIWGMGELSLRFYIINSKILIVKFCLFLSVLIIFCFSGFLLILPVEFCNIKLFTFTYYFSFRFTLIILHTYFIVDFGDLCLPPTCSFFMIPANDFPFLFPKKFHLFLMIFSLVFCLLFHWFMLSLLYLTV